MACSSIAEGDIRPSTNSPPLRQHRPTRQTLNNRQWGATTLPCTLPGRTATLLKTVAQNVAAQRHMCGQGEPGREPHATPRGPAPRRPNDGAPSSSTQQPSSRSPRHHHRCSCRAACSARSNVTLHQQQCDNTVQAPATARGSVRCPRHRAHKVVTCVPQTQDATLGDAAKPLWTATSVNPHTPQQRQGRRHYNSPLSATISRLRRSPLQCSATQSTILSAH